jgi:hypothetical protein
MPLQEWYQLKLLVDLSAAEIVDRQSFLVLRPRLDE